MEWLFGGWIVLCGIGAAVIVPLALKEERTARRQLEDAQSRASSLERQVAQLTTQLEETRRLNASLEQSHAAKQKELEHLSSELSSTRAEAQTLQARTEELERQLKAEQERHRGLPEGS